MGIDIFIWSEDSGSQFTRVDDSHRDPFASKECTISYALCLEIVVTNHLLTRGAQSRDFSRDTLSRPQVLDRGISARMQSQGATSLEVVVLLAVLVHVGRDEVG